MNIIMFFYFADLIDSPFVDPVLAWGCKINGQNSWFSKGGGELALINFARNILDDICHHYIEKLYYCYSTYYYCNTIITQSPPPHLPGSPHSSCPPHASRSPWPACLPRSSCNSLSTLSYFSIFSALSALSASEGYKKEHQCWSRKAGRIVDN